MIYEPKRPIMPPYLKSMLLYYLNNFWHEKDKIDALKSIMEYKKPICWCCKGSGKVKDTSQRDVVEGLKHADLINCPLCGGSKVMDLKFIHECYKEDLNYYKEELAKYRKKMELYKSITSKLTEEELNYIFN